MEIENRRAWPFRELVPDEATALTIGTAFIRAYFGDAVFEKWGPYTAYRIRDEWGVVGTNAELEAQVQEFERLNPALKMIVRGGGMPGVSFSAQDARVTSISYQR